MNNIREIRKAKGYTQAYLAKLLDTTRASVSRYETEDQRITLPLLGRIAKALRCEVVDLVSDKTESLVSRGVRVPLLSSENEFLICDKKYVEEIANKRAYQVSDDKMSGTLNEGDYCIFNEECKDLRDYGLFVISTDDGSIIVRTSYNNLTGVVELTCDNPKYSDYGTFEKKGLKELNVLGRVSQIIKMI